MSKNYEFISAAELPVAESKDVDVVCVEDGQMRRQNLTEMIGPTIYYGVVDDASQTIAVYTDPNHTVQAIYSDAKNDIMAGRFALSLIIQGAPCIANGGGWLFFDEPRGIVCLSLDSALVFADTVMEPSGSTTSLTSLFNTEDKQTAEPEKEA